MIAEAVTRCIWRAKRVSWSGILVTSRSPPVFPHPTSRTRLARAPLRACP